MTNRIYTPRGCAETCACHCHCHSDAGVIPPGHVAGCLFADPDYVPPGWRGDVEREMREFEDIVRGRRGIS